MKTSVHSILLTALLLLIPIVVSGQIHPHAGSANMNPVFNEIDRAYRQGDITADERMLQKYYTVLDQDKVMERFKPLSGNHPVKCLTPLIIEYNNRKDQLSPSARDEIQTLNNGSCSIQDTEHSYTSPSGKFIFHYDLEGPDAVPDEDYIMQAAFAADSSWNHEIGTIGFADPVGPPNGSPYEIYFKDFDPYGVTCETGSSTYIVLHSNFDGFPPNNHQDPQLGALYVTVAHELKHASQYATNRWRGDAGETNWVEMDAVMIEEVVFDEVDDYYHYLKSGGLESTTPDNSSIFGNPANPIPGAYEHATWTLYFTEMFGIDFWVDVWNQFIQQPLRPVLDAVNQALQDYDGGFPEHHTRNLLWHLASGPDAENLNFGFDEREHYPVPLYSHIFTDAPDSLESTGDGIEPLAANFFRVEPVAPVNGVVKVILEHDQPVLGLGLVAYFKDGNTDTDMLTRGQGISEIFTLWAWDDIEKLDIAVVNYSEDVSSNYQLILENPVTREITLYRNFPNPFQNSTNIEFGIGQPRHIRVEVFDITGRHIQTLRDQNYEPGIYTIEFDALGLASGVYICRLVSDGEVRSEKMVLIK